MPFDPASIIGNEIVKRSVDAVVKAFSGIKLSESTVEKVIYEHINYLERWSSTVQILNMANPVSVDTHTIELTISNKVRRLYSNKTDEFFDEHDIVSKSENFFLFGGPGAGKTTTIKRLCRRLLNITEESDSSAPYVPILIRCRDIPEDSSLGKFIFNMLHLELEKKEENVDKDQENKNRLNKISRFFDEARCHVFIDGIDECRVDLANSVIYDINIISQECAIAKFLCTSRSGSVASLPSNFSGLQLEPLDDSSKTAIINKWAKQPAIFMNSISKSAINQIASTPLFLIQIIILFDWHGYIPNRPYEVYEKLVILVLEIWDNQKGTLDIVSRKSAYEKFTPNYKLDFLSAFSYFLVNKQRLGRFTHDDFKEFFDTKHSQFGLPKSELVNVMNELESHTGFIFECGYRKFEFLHLTFQEYLAARYLSRDFTNAGRFRAMASTNTAVFAVLIAMSSIPEDLLARFLLDELSKNENNHKGLSVNYAGIIDRLQTELSVINQTTHLIPALAKFRNHLIAQNRAPALESLDRFAKHFNIEDNIKNAAENVPTLERILNKATRKKK